MVELGLKSLTLFGVSVYPRVSDMARLARDKTIFLATTMRYQYFGTKELLWWAAPFLVFIIKRLRNIHLSKVRSSGSGAYEKHK